MRGDRINAICNYVLQKQPPQVFLKKKLFLEISQNSQKNTCARASFLIKTLAQVFSCEFCEIFKNKFSTQHTQRTASGFKLSKYIFDKGLHISIVIIFSCARHDSKT